MSFSEKAKLTSLAIVHIFETSKPMGNYAAVAVLNDGAGVSYGISQFTHKSGSLEKVLRRYEKLNADVHSCAAYILRLEDRSPANIQRVSQDNEFKRLLKTAAGVPAMRQAQREIAFEQYLKPAIDACAGSGFVLPMSLAVIYDSINHGSWAKIRDLVPAHLAEKDWIKTYVTKRDAWLESVQRLRPTVYRTDFFLAQIARGNWNLDLPMNVHGYKLTEQDIPANDFADLRDDEISLDIPVQNSAAVPPADADATVDATAAIERVTAAPQSASAPVEVAVDAPPPTGFMAKLKAQGAAMLAVIGGGAGLKEWLGLQLSHETVELLKVLLPTVLGLGFIGFVVWYVSEKIVGFKTLKMQAEIATDPMRHDLVIRKQ